MARKTKTARSSAIVRGVLFFEDVEQGKLVNQFSTDEQKEEWEAVLSDKHLTEIRLETIAVDWAIRTWHGEGIEPTEKPILMEMTLRKENVKGKPYWYAYRGQGGRLLKRYVGKSDAVTEEKLVSIAKKFAGL